MDKVTRLQKRIDQLESENGYFRRCLDSAAAKIEALAKEAECLRLELARCRRDWHSDLESEAKK